MSHDAAKMRDHAQEIYRSALGSPVKSDANHDIYKVPWRTDNTPSLMVNRKTWIAFDNPTGWSGDVLGFVAKLKNYDIRREYPRVLQAAAELAGISSAPVAAAVTVPKNATPPPRTHPKYGAPSATYRYYDEHGNTIGYVCRFDTKPRKSFRPLVYTDQGWAWEYTTQWYPLYGLEKLAKQGDVLLVEGEKAADAAQSTLPDLICMSWMGGAERIKKIDLQPLHGRTVYLWPDRDDAGRKAMETAADLLLPIAHEVRLCKVPASLPEKWDLADPMPDGFNPADVIARASIVGPVKIKEVSSTEIARTEYPARPWLLAGVLSVGMAMVAAAPKVGKTYWCEDLALSVSAGHQFMGLDTRPGRALYIDPEMSGAIIKERQKQLGWPEGSNMLDFIFGEFQFDDSGFAFLDDYLERKPDTVLIVADTLARTVPTSDRRGKNAYQAEYAEMVPIQRWALERGITLLFVHHTNKLNPRDTTEAYDTGAGSRGIMAAMESILTFKRTKNKDVFAMNVTLRHGEGKDLALKRHGFKWEMLGDYDKAMVGQDRAALLKLLHDNGPMTPVELGESLDKKRNTISVMLRRMVAAGLVESAGSGRWQCGAGVGSYYDTEEGKDAEC